MECMGEMMKTRFLFVLILAKSVYGLLLRWEIWAEEN